MRAKTWASETVLDESNGQPYVRTTGQTNGDYLESFCRGGNSLVES